MNKYLLLKIFIFISLSIISISTKSQQTDFDDMKKRIKEIKYSIETSYIEQGPVFNITITFPANYFGEESTITVIPTFSGLVDLKFQSQSFVGSSVKDAPSNSFVVKYNSIAKNSFKVIPKLPKDAAGDLKLDLVILLKSKGVTQAEMKYPYNETFTIGEGKIATKVAEVKVIENNVVTDTAKVIDNIKDTTKTNNVIENSSTLNDILMDIAKYEKTGNTVKLAELNEQLGELNYVDKNYLEAKDAYLEAIENSKKNNTPAKTADLYTDVGKVDFAIENNLEAIEDYKVALEYYKTAGDKKRAELTYNNLATIYNSMSYYESAVNAYKEAINNAEGDKTKIGKYSSKIADSYKKMENLKETAEYYEKAIENEKATNNEAELVISYSNASTIYLEQGNYDKAEEYINNAIELNEKLNETAKLPTLYNNLGNIYFEKDELDDAKSNYEKSLNFSKESNNKNNEAIAYHNIGIVYFEKEEDDKAKVNFVKSNEIAEVEGLTDIVEKNNLMLNKIIARRNYSSEEFDLFNILQMQQSSFMANYDNPISDYTDKYNSDTMSKDELIDELKSKDNEIKVQQDAIGKQKLANDLLKSENDAKAARNKLLNYIIYGMTIGFLIMILLTIWAIREKRQKQKANNELKEKNVHILQQNEEIQAQSDELLEQKNELEKQNIEIRHQSTKINSSIDYAKNIQTAILPSVHALNNIVGEHFVLYMPKQIVSGDFYWSHKISNDEYIIIAADCTGHGVPGAMMSMLGYALLNEIVKANRITETDLIANNLRELIIKSLNQDLDVETEKLTKDGMDIAILKVNKKTKKVYFTGAENPLIIIRNNELIEFKADAMPIGATAFSRVHEPFTVQEIDIFAGDMLYTFSDGYADQFGGERHKKYYKKALYKFILENYKKPVNQQKEELFNEFIKWKDTPKPEDKNDEAENNIKKYEGKQIDDVLILGIKI